MDAANSPTAQFIFRIGTTFTSAALSEIVLLNGAQACNVYFIVGSSASIGEGAKMQGNVLAYTAVGAGEGARGRGTWCALNAAVTLINSGVEALAGTCRT